MTRFLILLILSGVTAIAASDAVNGAVILIPADVRLPNSPGYHEFRFQVRVGDKQCPMATGIFLPVAYFEAKAPFPLVIALHNVGAKGHEGGHSGEGLGRLISGNTGNDARAGGTDTSTIKDFKRGARFICLAPQCPADKGWETAPMPQVVMALVDALSAKYRIDADRMYVTGFSYGGSCTWTMALALPDRFAAIVPISGRAPDNPAASAQRLKHLPVLVGVGEQDHDWAVAGAKQMSDALKAAGCERLQHVIVPKGNHFCYGAIYGNPAFWDALLKLKRPASGAKP